MDVILIVISIPICYECCCKARLGTLKIIDCVAHLLQATCDQNIVGWHWAALTPDVALATSTTEWFPNHISTKAVFLSGSNAESNEESTTLSEIKNTEEDKIVLEAKESSETSETNNSKHNSNFCLKSVPEASSNMTPHQCGKLANSSNEEMKKTQDCKL